MVGFVVEAVVAVVNGVLALVPMETKIKFPRIVLTGTAVLAQGIWVGVVESQGRSSNGGGLRNSLGNCHSTEGR